MSTLELTSENFDQVIQDNDFVIVDFWAEWCGPCKNFAPVYDAASEKHPEVLFAKVDTEKQAELSSHFQIRSIPTLMVFREKIIIGRFDGALSSPDFETLIEKAGTLNMAQVKQEIENSQAQQNQNEQENDNNKDQKQD